MVISHPSSNHYTGFLFHSQLFTRFLSLPISASMAMPHLILRNSLFHNLLNVRSVLLHHTVSNKRLSFALWEIGLSAHLLRVCGMLCLVIYGLHNLSMFLNVASKLTFLAKPLNTFFVVVVVLFHLNCLFYIYFLLF